MKISVKSPSKEIIQIQKIQNGGSISLSQSPTFIVSGSTPTDNHVISVNTPGEHGVPGSQILKGIGSPSNSVGINGDYYIDTTTNVLYGPKNINWDFSSTIQLSEEDVMYSKRIDFVTDNIIYRGEAIVGSLENSPVWRIRKIVIENDNDVTEVWANGISSFAHIWSDRLTYIYS